MKLLVALSLLAGSAWASLNCTLIADAVERVCEWDECDVAAQRKVGDIVHAGCRADCSDDKSVWFKLYNGNYIRADSATVNSTTCIYHDCVYAKGPMGLPRCFEETRAEAPSNCAARSSMGVAKTIPTPAPLGPEPAKFPGVC